MNERVIFWITVVALIISVGVAVIQKEISNMISIVLFAVQLVISHISHNSSQKHNKYDKDSEVDNKKWKLSVFFLIASTIFLILVFAINQHNNHKKDGVDIGESVSTIESVAETQEQNVSDLSTANETDSSHLEVFEESFEILNYENESNDNPASANTILPNQKYSGKISTDEDVDYYKFVISSKGKISISFEHKKIDLDSTFWEIYLSNQNQDDERKLFNSSGSASIITSDNIRLPSGTYFIKVKSYYHDSSMYSFIVNYSEEDSAFESEKNDSFDNATSIVANCSYTGNLHNKDDVDYYMFALTTKGRISISFDHSKIDSNDTFWIISIIDGKQDNTICSIRVTGNEAKKQSGHYRIPAGDYYLKIENYYYCNVDYTFIVLYDAEGNDVESESNNSYEDANRIEISKQYIGNLQDKDDVDFFYFVLDYDCDVEISFGHEKEDDDSTFWRIYSSEYYDNSFSKIISSTGNESIKQSETMHLSSGTYYIKVESYYHNSSDYYLQAIIV